MKKISVLFVFIFLALFLTLAGCKKKVNYEIKFDSTNDIKLNIDTISTKKLDEISIKAPGEYSNNNYTCFGDWVTVIDGKQVYVNNNNLKDILKDHPNLVLVTTPVQAHYSGNFTISIKETYYYDNEIRLDIKENSVSEEQVGGSYYLENLGEKNLLKLIFDLALREEKKEQEISIRENYFYNYIYTKKDDKKEYVAGDINEAIEYAEQEISKFIGTEFKFDLQHGIEGLVRDLFNKLENSVKDENGTLLVKEFEKFILDNQSRFLNLLSTMFNVEKKDNKTTITANTISLDKGILEAKILVNDKDFFVKGIEIYNKLNKYYEALNKKPDDKKDDEEEVKEPTAEEMYDIFKKDILDFLSQLNLQVDMNNPEFTMVIENGTEKKVNAHLVMDNREEKQKHELTLSLVSNNKGQTLEIEVISEEVKQKTINHPAELDGEGNEIKAAYSEEKEMVEKYVNNIVCKNEYDSTMTPREINPADYAK